MGKFISIKNKYLAAGVSENNIDFAIESVSDGIKREHTLETLTADYRGMSVDEATRLLEDLYAANGGEFKKENRGGYLYGILALVIGALSIGYLVMAFTGSEEQKLKFILLTGVGAVAGIGGGIYFIAKAIHGKYRDDTNPIA